MHLTTPQSLLATHTCYTLCDSAVVHRDSVRAELAQAVHKRTADEEGAAQEEAPSKRAKVQGIPEDVMNDLVEVNKALSNARKKRVIPDATASKEDIEGFTLLGSYPLHKTTAGGITAIDLNPDQVSCQDWRAASNIFCNVVEVEELLPVQPMLWQCFSAHAAVARLLALLLGTLEEQYTTQPNRTGLLHLIALFLCCYLRVSSAGLLEPMHHATCPWHIDLCFWMLLMTVLHMLQDSVVATAGLDATVQLFDLQQQRQLGELIGHSKRVTGVHYSTADIIVTSSADKSIRLWTANEGEAADGTYRCSSVLTQHTGDVVGISMHPSKRYFASASEDSTWAFWDINRAECLKQVGSQLNQLIWAGGQALSPDRVCLVSAARSGGYVHNRLSCIPVAAHVSLLVRSFSGGWCTISTASRSSCGLIDRP